MGPPPPNTATEISPRIWVLRYFELSEVTTEGSRHLLPPLVEASKQAPIVVLVVTPPGLRLVAGDLVSFWLDAFRNKGLKVLGLGVLAESRAVRVAVSGFELAMKLSGSPIAVTVEKYEPALIAWGHALLRKADGALR